MRSILGGTVIFLCGFAAAALMITIMDAQSTAASAPETAKPAAPAPSTSTASPEAEEEPRKSPKEQTADFAQSLGVQTLLAIKANARDPGSVRFRDVFTVNLGDDDERLILVCGQVTGRNGFGGYTGYIPFVATSEMDIKFPDTPGFQGFYGDCTQGKPVTSIYM